MADTAAKEAEESLPSPKENQAEADEYHRFVGIFLRAERERKEITPAEAAARAGRSNGWVSQVERGQNDSHKAAKLLALAIGTDFSYIVALAENAVDAQTRARNLTK